MELLTTNMNIELFGERLRKVRIERDLNQDQLASLSGVAQATISEYESGKRRAAPRSDQVVKLATTLEVTTDYLLGLVDIPLSNLRGNVSTTSTFGARLKHLRTDANLSQRAVAEALNITAATVSRYETGEMTPTEEVIRNTALLFKVSADFLLGLSDKPYGELAPHIEESIQENLKELRRAEEDFEDVKRFEELRRDLMRFLVETLVKGGRADSELPELLDKYISEHPLDSPRDESG